VNLHSFLKDPFRFFFPLGWLAGVLGVGLWLPLTWGEPSFYPVQTHRLTMIGGFLLAFVTGFLTTALPQFTSTASLRLREFFLLVTSQLGAIGFALGGIASAHYLFVFLTLIILSEFAARRFFKRNENPPFTFIFIGAGLLLWGMASIALVLDQFQRIPAMIVEPARSIYFHGALLCLVIGVGGRLIPGILEWRKTVAEQRSRYENAESYPKAIPASLWVALLVFMGSYLFEGQIQSQFLWLLRACVTLYVALRYWKLYRLPSERTGFTWGIWIACWCFVVGMLMPVLWPTGGIHGVHMVFIGGFSLLTILIATRVTLAHGTGDKELESSSLIVKALIFFFILSMFTRVTAIVWPAAYRSHLGYAALLWIAGIVLWAYRFIPRMLNNFEISRKQI
jgi:uncharacterized protein involved in response to NO